ncbi:MAG TPA: hypothetical protein VE078_02435, partial [Thermoanaerobaculia bacterium]|nr:hypothetical protein [Thermoanaerobaculia bacterium]
MDEEFSWALPEGIEEREEPVSSTSPSPRLRPTPSSREEILRQVGPGRIAVYEMVRACVDELEGTAPWRLLYYPPEEREAFFGILDDLIQLIESIPKRVATALTKIPAGEPESDDEPTREDVRFMFSGIHRMVAHDLKRLENTLTPVRERGPEALPTLDERQLLCELSADLKGKYGSSMMGAAASLIAQGLWNGVEIEPILFPEKAEEFRTTRELVDLLRELLQAIKQLPEQVHFSELVAGWQQGIRADQYALADLPSLRGRLAKLLKQRTRRALYSGDYHQISRREILLSERINELETLHQKTWTTTDHGGGQDVSPAYDRLVQLTLEMAAVLDVTLLKGLIGEKKVESLRSRVIAAKNRPAPTASKPGAGLDSLIPLLAEDDLRIFLELLLGAVLRRASLSVILKEAAAREATAPAAEWKLPPPIPEYSPAPPAPARKGRRSEASIPPPPSPIPEPDLEMWTPSLDPLDFALPELGPPSPMPAMPAMAELAPRPNLRPALKGVSELLNELLAPANANLSSFKMTQRLLSKHARIPAAMFQSTYPYLKDIHERLLPALKEITPFHG